MISKVLRDFSRGHVVCLLANSQKADRIGADLMRNIKAISDTDVKFIGSGGEYMEKEGLDSFYSTDLFHPKPFVPFRGTLAEEGNVWLWWKRNPITKANNGPMHQVLKIIKSKNLIEKIQGYRPGVILTLDHDILSFRIHKQFSELYKNSPFSRPKQVHYGKFINRYMPYQLEYLDHVLYTMPIEPKDWNKFKFPSTYIGQSGFEKAYRFLLERNGGDHLLTDNSVKVSIDHFYSETEQYIEAERKTFRTKNQIPETATVLFLAPGSHKTEVSWSIPILNKTANQFITEHTDPKNSNPQSVENFCVVIPTNESNYKQILGTVDVLGWKSRVIVLRTEEDRRSAQAGSDLAISYNGDIVTECLVNQLSTIVIQNMKKLEFYFLLYWNRFTNDMNIIADGNLFPEIIEGQCHPAKLLQLLNQWYESPAHKFWPLQGFESHIHRTLPMKVRELGMGTHHEYYSPDYLLSQSIWEFLRQSPKRDFAEDQNLFIQNLRLNSI
jgi:lipid A disaccharide synthetase